MKIGFREETADDHKATSIHDPNALASDQLDNPAHRTFYAVKGEDGKDEILWQGTPVPGTVFGSFVLSVEYLRHLISEATKKHIEEYAEKSRLHDRITSLLDRRIEIAVKDFEKQAIQDAKNACREAILKRVRAAVEAAPIRVEVTTLPPAPAGAA